MSAIDKLIKQAEHARRFPTESAEAATIVHHYLNGFSPPYEAWHHIDNAHNDLLREIIKQLVHDNIAVRAELVVAREDADLLALHLGKLSDELYEERYTLKGPCPGCYDALEAHAAVVASRTKETSDG